MPTSAWCRRWQKLTPDKKDFIITYVVEEGPRYKFGDVTVDSSIRDFNNDALAKATGIKKGEWFNAKQVEDTVEKLGETAGAFGYAFTEVSPDYQRDAETLTMGINFRIAEAKRSYIERVDITGNTVTQDKVIRREMRLAEGDAFNSLQVKRSTDRINSLGYFQDKFEVKETAGSAPDRIILEAPLEERATGELQLSAGYSSLERFLIQASIAQRNFRGKGQTVRASINYSSYSKSMSSASPSHTCSTRRLPWGSTCSGAIITRSASAGTTETRLTVSFQLVSRCAPRFR